MTPLTARTYAGSVRVSPGLLADVHAYRDDVDAFWGEVVLDMAHGFDARHHPDRSDLWAIERPERVRRNVKWNLENAGLGSARFGTYRKAPR